MLERTIREEAGHCELHDEQKLSSGIVTHELLVLASNTVSAVCDVGQNVLNCKQQLRIICNGPADGCGQLR